MNETIDYNEIIEVPEQGLDPFGKAMETGKIDRILVPREHIAKRIKALARQISDDYKNYHEITIVSVLKGAFVFASDLAREIYDSKGPDLKFEFMKTSTYGEEIKGENEIERNVRIELEPKDIQGKDILIVEDLVDQCFTLCRIKEYLSKNAKSLKLCVLLEKRLVDQSPQVEELKKNLDCDYIGFRVPDRWVAGYGIDSSEDFRQLPFIIAVNENYYR